MEKFYIPTLLQNENVKIAAMFPTKARIVRPGEMSETLKHLILTLVGLRSSQVSRFGKERTEAEVSSLAGYVCTNTLSVQCANIYALLDEFASADDWKLLFGDWQDYSDNQEAATFLKSGAERNSNFISYLTANDIPRENLSWIDENNKVQAICNNCKALDSYEEYKEALMRMGLIDDTLLMTTCQAKFYLNCSAKAYRDANETGVCSAFTKLDYLDRLDMIVNFIRVFSVDELTKYVTVYKQFKTEIEKNALAETVLMDRLKKAGLQDKYYSWVRRMMIIVSFYNDPYRRAFWLQYSGATQDMEVRRFSDHKRQSPKEIFIMDFGDYVVTEFLGKAEGKAYLFAKSSFEFYKSRIPVNSRNDFKAIVNNHFFTGVLERMAHSGGTDKWWPDFKSKLAKYGIRMIRA
jgi:hypothetical protein